MILKAKVKQNKKEKKVSIRCYHFKMGENCLANISVIHSKNVSGASYYSNPTQYFLSELKMFKFLIFVKLCTCVIDRLIQFLFDMFSSTN